MAGNRRDKPEATQEAKQAAAPAFFTPAQLITGAAHFGTSPEIMAGALYGVMGEITREEATKRLDAFLKKPVRATKEE
jgi:hypothetical protein